MVDLNFWRLEWHLVVVFFSLQIILLTLCKLYNSFRESIKFYFDSNVSYLFEFIIFRTWTSTVTIFFSPKNKIKLVNHLIYYKLHSPIHFSSIHAFVLFRFVPFSMGQTMFKWIVRFLSHPRPLSCSLPNYSAFLFYSSFLLIQSDTSTKCDFTKLYNKFRIII